jgi:hypothetical protein
MFIGSYEFGGMHKEAIVAYYTQFSRISLDGQKKVHQTPQLGYPVSGLRFEAGTDSMTEHY